jgi:hypothetical protein
MNRLKKTAAVLSVVCGSLSIIPTCRMKLTPLRRSVRSSSAAMPSTIVGACSSSSSVNIHCSSASTTAGGGGRGRSRRAWEEVAVTITAGFGDDAGVLEAGSSSAIESQAFEDAVERFCGACDGRIYEYFAMLGEGIYRHGGVGVLREKKAALMVGRWDLRLMDAQGTRSQCATLVDALVPTHVPHA